MVTARKETAMNEEDRSLTLTMIMEPRQANIFGNIHGGEIMRLMDTTAGATAIKYVKSNVVTARVDELQFLKPIHIGNFVTSTGTIVYTGNTSIEIHVTVDAEDLRRPNSKGRAIEAFFTLVALDENERPTRVPSFAPGTEREKAMYEHVKTRREFDRKRHEEAKKHMGGSEREV
jgi:uncharacterized protein (TIGR00369 family)